MANIWFMHFNNDKFKLFEMSFYRTIGCIIMGNGIGIRSHKFALYMRNGLDITQKANSKSTQLLWLMGSE